MTDLTTTTLIENEHEKVLQRRKKLLNALYRFMSREVTDTYRSAQLVLDARENDMLWALEQLTLDEIAETLQGLADAFLEGDE